MQSESVTGRTLKSVNTPCAESAHGLRIAGDFGRLGIDVYVRRESPIRHCRLLCTLGIFPVAPKMHGGFACRPETTASGGMSIRRKQSHRKSSRSHGSTHQRNRVAMEIAGRKRTTAVIPKNLRHRVHPGGNRSLHCKAHNEATAWNTHQS